MALRFKRFRLPKQKTYRYRPVSELRLDARLKRIYARTLELIERGWIQGSWMEDQYGGMHTRGWDNHEFEAVAVCAVGGLQRAAWEEMGKPDMSVRKNEKRVAALAHRAELRANYVVDRLTDGVPDPGYEIDSLMGLNDYEEEPAEAKQCVIEVLKFAGNLE